MEAPGLFSPDWEVPENVRAIQTTRRGGFSCGPWSGFNLALHTADEPERVWRNRELLTSALRLPQVPRWPQQVHGVKVIDAAMLPGTAADADPCDQALDSSRDSPWVSSRDLSRGSSGGSSGISSRNSSRGTSWDFSGDSSRHSSNHSDAGGDSDRLHATEILTNVEADAVMTRVPGVVCSVQTADCLPVLFAVEDGSAVAAAHAGWRGLCHGVLEATLSALATDPSKITVWLGPAIGPKVFEVGPEVRDCFCRDDTQAGEAFTAGVGDRWYADLYALARLRLRRAGVERIAGGGFCTYSSSDEFFSYRRDGVTGRMATLIWMELPAG